MEPGNFGRINNHLTTYVMTIYNEAKYLLIMGGFNAKHGAWNEGAKNRNGPLVYNWILSSNLILLNQNKEPTYQSPSSGSLSTLDPVSYTHLDVYKRQPVYNGKGVVIYIYLFIFLLH